MDELHMHFARIFTMAQIQDEIFEISDFTVVTDWEKFMLQLETTIHEWQLNSIPEQIDPLPKGFLEHASWATRKSQEVSFCALNFTVQHSRLCGGDGEGQVPKSVSKSSSNLMAMQKHCPTLIRDMLDVNNDFPPLSHNHSIAKFFGLREFAVLYPAAKSDFVINENKRNAIMSCVHMALSSTNCEIPFFLMVDDASRRLYTGVCQNRNIRTSFEMVHLKHAPPKARHLAGLLDIFKEKVACPLVTPPPVKVSVKVTYKLQESFESQWTVPPPDFEDASSSSPSLTCDAFPFGTFQDPISEIRLAVTWPSVNEDMLVENDVYSDLDPASAPYWALSVAFQTGIECMMSEKLKEFWNLSKCKFTVDEMLGIEDRPVGESALGRLTEPPVSRIVRSTPAGTGGSLEERFPLNDDVMEEWIEKIFGESGKEETSVFTTEEPRTPKTPDATPLGTGQGVDPYGSVTPGKLVSVRRRNSSLSVEAPVDAELQLRKLQESLLGAKISPKDGLTWRVSVSLNQVLSSMQGVGALCQLWREVVLTLRDFWERGELLPRIPEEHPNLGTCLFHQKLTMLQCCIGAKRKRMSLKNSASQRLQRSDSDSSLEFYDCEETTPSNSKEEMEVKTDKSLLIEPEGRLEQFECLTLLHQPDEKLFIPVTQDPSPMTEDMLEEQVEVLSKLATCADGSAKRTKMQVDSLVSDMEAFKAANPKSTLEDFVRWHSPRDWVEEVSEETREKTGRLSTRMANAGNLWMETWESARPVPVTRQKRLFNESKEAEKILHWLASQSVDELCLFVLPSLFAAALTQLSPEAKDVYQLIGDKLVSLCDTFIAVSKQRQNFDDYLDLLRHVNWIEMTVSQFRSIKSRLSTVHTDKKRKVSESEMRAFVLALMENHEVPILGASNSPMGHIVNELFQNDVRIKKGADEAADPTRRNFPTSLFKEYMMRWFLPRPAQYSRPSPQKMYALVHPDMEFRLAGAFSEDVTFM